MSHRLYANSLGRIVDPSGKGDFTTIATALTASVSGQTIFIRPGTYTENLTLKAGVNLCAFECDSQRPNVTIVGKCSGSYAGSVSISGIRLKTNGANCIELTGSAGTTLTFINCYIEANDFTAINSTASSANLRFYQCRGNLNTTGIAYFTISDATAAKLFKCDFDNGAGSTTASTVSAGGVALSFCVFTNAITSSGTASLEIVNSLVFITNTTALTFGGSGSCTLAFSNVDGGTASAISVGASATLVATECEVASSNTNAITGAGAIEYAGLVFSSSSNTMNVTTQTALVSRPGITRSSHQPAFLAYVNTQIDNVTGDTTNYTVIFDTEVYDQNNDFNLGTSTFTAPYTGKYFLQFDCQLLGGTAISSTGIKIVTSNRTYRAAMYEVAGATSAATGTISVVADMDATDTATFTVFATDSGGKVLDIAGVSGSDIRTFASGYLVC